jgi:uncharacterized protein with ParB-like and HNH nuclease domain
MNATNPTLATILQTSGAIDHYHVPKYQREYTWGTYQWEQLLNDIDENEEGYFMGSIICIVDDSATGPGVSKIYQVIDGQQRLTTISLHLMAIYRKIAELKDSLQNADEEEIFQYKNKLNDIQRRLIYRKKDAGENEAGRLQDKNEKEKFFFLRVQPSTQNNNFIDYLHILSELRIIQGEYRTNYCWVRRLYKAYEFFYSNLPDDYDQLEKLYNKLNSLQFIHITVGSSSDAFILFESLNNRGVPLSVMDIIKNKLLAQLEKQKQMDVDDAYEEWQSLLRLLPDFNDQERFLRQYYNAFKIYPEIKIEGQTKATRSSLIKIYETYINKNAKVTLDNLLQKAEIYNMFISPETNGLSDPKNAHLLDLQRIGSAPSYLLLLYLWSLDKELFDDKDIDLINILLFFIKYYIRRNITDFPNTRDLDAINMDVIEKCDSYSNQGYRLNSQFIIEAFMNGRGKPSDLNIFKERLSNNLFYHNSGMARFLLAKIAEVFYTKEYNPDLWARNPSGLLVWTVEHIFPQGASIPDEWIAMIAGGDRCKAEEIRQKIGHCLGNLTLSGYNSQLSNASFEKKQGLYLDKPHLGHKINIGYKNKLSLNTFPFKVNGKETNLAEIDKWTEECIIARNKSMVEFIIELFAFDWEK